MHAEPAVWQPSSVGPWAMRPLGPADEPFLDELYEGTRIEEVRGWGLGPVEARAFLQSQASTQRRAYALQFPGAENWAIVKNGRPIGRLIVYAEGDSRWRIVDISVLPAERGHGAAAWAIGELLERAKRSSRTVRLLVEIENRARRLYERLGFQVIGDDGQRFTMEWSE